MQYRLRQFKASAFQALGHPTRIAIMELLRDSEKSASSLIALLGMEQSSVSQHLTVLRTQEVVVSRKEGNQVFYSVGDPLLIEVLDVMRRYFESHVTKALALLEQVKYEEAQEQV